MNKRRRLAGAMKKCRLENGLTLKEMGRLCGVDPRTIWNLEKARVDPHERTLARIRKAFPAIFEEFPDLWLDTWGDPEGTRS